MTLVWMMEMTIMQIIDVTVGPDGRVAATRPMLMSMVGMRRSRAGRHGVMSFLCPRSAETAVRPSAAWSIALLTIGGKLPGRHARAAVNYAERERDFFGLDRCGFTYKQPMLY